MTVLCSRKHVIPLQSVRCLLVSLLIMKLACVHCHQQWLTAVNCGADLPGSTCCCGALTVRQAQVDSTARSQSWLLDYNSMLMCPRQSH